MKQFDSYLLFGCHLSNQLIEIILKNTTLNFFNSKISLLYDCEIIKLNVIMTDTYNQENYFLKIRYDNEGPTNLLRSDDFNELLNETKIQKFEKLLETLDQQVVKPYLISIPIVRELDS